VRLWQQAYDLAQQHAGSSRGFCVTCGVTAPCRIATAAEDAMRRAVAADSPTVAMPVIPDVAESQADVWHIDGEPKPEPPARQRWEPAAEDYDPGLTAPAVSPWQPQAGPPKPPTEPSPMRRRSVGARYPRYYEEDENVVGEELTAEPPPPGPPPPGPPPLPREPPPADVQEPVGARFRRESRIGKRRRR
jgi:hypothetical protein